jgi:hypothetical protein
MRSIPIILGLICAAPTFARAQDATAGCTTLAIIQSQGCLVRRVFVCDATPDDVINVGSYGPEGPTSVAIFNADGRTLETSFGPGTPKITLGEQTDPLSLRILLATEQDSFDYQMVHETVGAAQISGQITTSGEMITIDGRSLQVLLAEQTLVPPVGEARATVIRYLYDAGLRLMLTDTITDAATGDIRDTRTPVDFIWPGEAGFQDYVPLYGCGS